MVSTLGKGALLAKFDIESAFRNISIHPSHRYLLGMKWRSKYYVELLLLFGLRSAPGIFNSVADIVEWILKTNYAISELLHYLDDFITAGPVNSPSCTQRLNTAISVVSNLGLPLHPQKCIGPATSLVVLGIELDTVVETVRLPTDKFTAIYNTLQQWSSFKWCRKTDLQSLIGLLHHACKVVWPGRTFLRRMIDLISCFRNDSHPIHLNGEFIKDLQWWLDFFSQWNDISFFLFPDFAPPPNLSISTDASGAIGYGTHMSSDWFNGQWLPHQPCLSIAYKELFPVVLAEGLWGIQWSRQPILFQVDNEAVVHILNARTSPDPNIMHLLRSLHLVAAQHCFTFSARHVPGINNSIADALSRFHWQAFRRLAPDAKKFPINIPPQLLARLSKVI